MIRTWRQKSYRRPKRRFIVFVLWRFIIGLGVGVSSSAPNRASHAMYHCGVLWVTDSFCGVYPGRVIRACACCSHNSQSGLVVQAQNAPKSSNVAVTILRNSAVVAIIQLLVDYLVNAHVTLWLANLKYGFREMNQENSMTIRTSQVSHGFCSLRAAALAA